MKILCLLALLCAPFISRSQYLADNNAPKDIQKLFLAGEKAQRSGDLQLAIDLFEQVLRTDPDHVNAYLQRGWSYIMDKQYESAVRDFGHAIELEPENHYAYISRASANNRLERFKDAVVDLDRVIAMDPKNEEAYNNRGWSRKGLGDLPAACKDWRTSQRLGNAEAKIILSNTRCK